MDDFTIFGCSTSIKWTRRLRLIRRGRVLFLACLLFKTEGCREAIIAVFSHVDLKLTALFGKFTACGMERKILDGQGEGDGYTLARLELDLCIVAKLLDGTDHACDHVMNVKLNDLLAGVGSFVFDGDSDLDGLVGGHDVGGEREMIVGIGVIGETVTEYVKRIDGGIKIAGAIDLVGDLLGVLDGSACAHMIVINGALTDRIGEGHGELAAGDRAGWR